MSDTYYWKLYETADRDLISDEELLPEVTMLATGDLLQDINTMRQTAAEGPWRFPVIQFYRSSGYGDEFHEDGKDKYRAHQLVISLTVHAPEVLQDYP